MKNFIVMARCARAIVASHKRLKRLAFREIWFQQMYGLRQNRPFSSLYLLRSPGGWNAVSQDDHN